MSTKAEKLLLERDPKMISPHTSEALREIDQEHTAFEAMREALLNIRMRCRTMPGAAYDSHGAGIISMADKALNLADKVTQGK